MAMQRAASFLLVALTIPLTSCADNSCEKSWLWGWDRRDDLRTCAESGHRRSQLRYGELLALNGHPDQSRVWLARATEGRGAEGAMDVARAFAGYEGDPRIAEEWYRKAFELGSWEAARELGLLRHKTGQPAEANGWFEKAVERGGGWAANSIGFRLLHQLDDAAAASTWYQRGAQMGDPGSMSEYARMLEGGIGVASDPVEAFRWRLSAAKHEKADGYHLLDLARVYDEGIGTPRNPRAALAAVQLAKDKSIDDSDYETPKKIEAMEKRLKSELQTQSS